MAEAWNGFLVIHDTDHRLIGLCAFALAPDAQGAVEIAYAIAPSYQGQGYATEAAQALTARAFCVPGARVACAHTAPETNASTRVLVKCGFQKIGEIMHPEDGRIWRWEKRP